MVCLGTSYTLYSCNNVTLKLRVTPSCPYITEEVTISPSLVVVHNASEYRPPDRNGMTVNTGVQWEQEA